MNIVGEYTIVPSKNDENVLNIYENGIYLGIARYDGESPFVYIVNEELAINNKEKEKLLEKMRITIETDIVRSGTNDYDEFIETLKNPKLNKPIRSNTFYMIIIIVLFIVAFVVQVATIVFSVYGIFFIWAAVYAYSVEKAGAKYNPDNFNFFRMLKNAFLGPFFIYKYRKTFGTFSISHFK